jgi:hypothetical protein
MSRDDSFPPAKGGHPAGTSYQRAVIRTQTIEPCLMEELHRSRMGQKDGPKTSVPSAKVRVQACPMQRKIEDTLSLPTLWEKENSNDEYSFCAQRPDRNVKGR